MPPGSHAQTAKMSCDVKRSCPALGGVLQGVAHEAALVRFAVHKPGFQLGGLAHLAVVKCAAKGAVRADAQIGGPAAGPAGKAPRQSRQLVEGRGFALGAGRGEGRQQRQGQKLKHHFSHDTIPPVL